MTLRHISLDQVWDLADVPYGSGLLTQDHHYAKVFAVKDSEECARDFQALLAELNGKTGLSLYTNLVDGRRYTHAVLTTVGNVPLRSGMLRKKSFSRALENYVAKREAEITALQSGHKHLLSCPVTDQSLRCFAGFIYSSHVVDFETFTTDKVLQFQSNGEIQLLTTGKDPYFQPYPFYVISVLDAPYSSEFWQNLLKFDGDFWCVVSLDRIDQTFAESLLDQTRNVYHATKRESKLPDIAKCFRYSTTFVYSAAKYTDLAYFLSHLRYLGCNVQVQSVRAEEALSNILPPGRVFGECATDNPGALFLTGTSSSKQISIGPAKLQPVPKTQLCKAIHVKTTRNQPLCQKWPLISYDESSGTLMTDRHDFFRIYSLNTWWDPHLCPVNYPAIDRALNTLGDNKVSLTYYLLRAPIDPLEATHPLMYDQLSYLRDQKLAWKTKGFIVLNYRLQERNLKTLYNVTHEQMQQVIAERLDDVDKHLRSAEEAFSKLTSDRLTGNRLLEFFNPFLNSNAQSLEYFLQDPLSTHYLSEYLADTDMDVQGRYMYFNGRFYGTIAVLDYSLNVRSDFYKVLLSSYPMQFTVCAKMNGLTSSEQDTLLRRRQRIFYSARATALTGVPDPRADMQAAQMEEAQVQQYARGERIFDTQIIMMQSAESPEELEKNQNELMSKIRLLGFTPLRPIFGTGTLFFSCLPPAPIYKSLNRRTTTSVATHLLPIHLTVANQNLHDADAVFVDRTGTPDGFRVFDEARVNQHAIITGSSGQGKTLLGEWLLESHMARHPGQTSITVIDLGVVQGGSYRNLVDENGGEYFPLDYNTEVGFDIMSRLQRTPENKAELNFVAYMIQEMTADPKARTEGRSGVTITQSEAYELLRAFTSNTKPEDINLENFIYRYTLRAEFEECMGRLGNFFFNPKVVNLENPLICFDFQSLSRDRHLVSLLSYFLMQNVWLSVTDERYKYKFLLVDELGLIIDNPMIASWLEQLIRAGRKAGLAVWLISQQLKDIAKSPHAPALVDNCAETLLMKQGYCDLMASLNITADDWQEIAPNSEPRVFSEFLRTGINIDRLFIPPAYLIRRHTDYLDRFTQIAEQTQEKEKDHASQDVLS